MEMTISRTLPFPTFLIHKIILRLPFSVFVGLRYAWPKRLGHSGKRNGFVSFMAFASCAGIALGVAALIVVLSVMNGFQKEVRDRMLAVVSHIEIFGSGAPLPDWRATLAEAKLVKAVTAGAPYVLGQGMLTGATSGATEAVRGAVIRGIDPALEGTVSDIREKMKRGQLAQLAPGEFNVILGAELARALGALPGDKVTLIVPQGNVTPAGVIPRLKQFNVTGIFEAGHYEYDASLALVHLEDAQKLFRSEGASGVRLKTDNLYDAPAIAANVARAVSGNVVVRDWSRINKNWFAAVQVEKRMMFIILTLIVAVAAFNLVSSLVMTVNDKRADIAILRTLGASPGAIMRIFVVQGALIGVAGVLLGVVGGTALALNLDVVVPAIERALGVQFLNKDIYFINTLPSDVRWPDIMSITGISLALAFLATLYPSWKAARTQPAEALRYE
jgi:lipoprotein-releasing system permease protein